MTAGVKVVSGSTGWMNEHGDEMRRLCREQGRTLFWTSNFSLGVAIFSAVNKYLAKIMNQFPTYDVSMTETHHVHKLDAPSGTAITLAESIVEHLDRKTRWVKGTLQAPDGTLSGTTACAADELPVSSIRRDEVPAYTPSATKARRTASSSPTTPKTAAASPWAPCWPPNTPRNTRAGWGWKTCSRF